MMQHSNNNISDNSTMCSSTSNHTSLNSQNERVCLPDPSQPRFGMHATRWARGIDNDNKCEMVEIGNENDLVDVSVGFWTSPFPRHMELVLRLDRVNDEDGKKKRKRSPKNVSLANANLNLGFPSRPCSETHDR